MASWWGRNDWEAALRRWSEAGLLDDAAREAIQAWESERQSRDSPSRLVDALSYVGVSIVLVGALLAVGLIDASDVGTVILPLMMGLAAVVIAWFAVRSQLRAVSDGFAAVAVVLITVSLGFGLERVGGRGAYEVGFFLICLCVLLVGALMLWLVQSRLAAFLASAAIGLMPFSIAASDDAAYVFFYAGAADSLIGWELWGTFAALIAVGAMAQVAMLRPSRFLNAQQAPYARLGASLATSAAILWLAEGSPAAAIDWMSLLAGWLVAAFAFRWQRAELLPASAVLLLGALAGGLADLGSEAQVTLTIVVLFTALQLTFVGMVVPRLLGPLGEHWLTPVWQGALLGAGVVAAAFLAAEHDALTTIGIAWGLLLLVAGILRRRPLEMFFGAVGVYATGLTLMISLESTLGAVIGSLVFGLLLVAGAIVWRRRSAAIDLD